MFLFSVCFLFISCNSSEQEHQDQVEILYHTHCIRCHGGKGNLGVSGAADLTKSILSNAEKKSIINAGKGNMPTFGTTLTNGEIENLVEFVNEFKK